MLKQKSLAFCLMPTQLEIFFKKNADKKAQSFFIIYSTGQYTNARLKKMQGIKPQSMRQHNDQKTKIYYNGSNLQAHFSRFIIKKVQKIS